MTWRKLLTAMTALAAMLVVITASPPSYARELQRLETATPEQMGMSSARLERIAEALKKEVGDGKLPGAVVIVARKGKIVYLGAAGFQDKGANKPMAADSIFRIYSMTKPLVSVAAMMLVEDGVIQLTDPVSKFLPAFKDMQVSVATTSADGRVTYSNVPAVRPITVQDLLRHTAGLAYAEITKNEPVKTAYVEAKFSQPGVHEFDSRAMTPAEQVERIAKAPLIHQPGTHGSIAWRSIFSAVWWRLLPASDSASSWMSACSSRSKWSTRASGCPRPVAAYCAALGCRSRIRPKDQRAPCIRRTGQQFRRSRGALDRDGLLRFGGCLLTAVS